MVIGYILSSVWLGRSNYLDRRESSAAWNDSGDIRSGIKFDFLNLPNYRRLPFAGILKTWTNDSVLQSYHYLTRFRDNHQICRKPSLSVVPNEYSTSLVKTLIVSP